MSRYIEFCKKTAEKYFNERRILYDKINCNLRYGSYTELKYCPKFDDGIRAMVINDYLQSLVVKKININMYYLSFQDWF